MKFTYGASPSLLIQVDRYKYIRAYLGEPKTVLNLLLKVVVPGRFDLIHCVSM